MMTPFMHCGTMPQSQKNRFIHTIQLLCISSSYCFARLCARLSLSDYICRLGTDKLLID